jgi:hypothetical protein
VVHFPIGYEKLVARQWPHSLLAFAKFSLSQHFFHFFNIRRKIPYSFG